MGEYTPRSPDVRVRHYAEAMESLWDQCTAETRAEVRELLLLLCEDEETVVPG